MKSSLVWEWGIEKEKKEKLRNNFILPEYYQKII